jgi:hypothetical protein
VFNNATTTYGITDPIYQEIDVSQYENPQPKAYQYFYDQCMQNGDTVTILDADEFLESDFTINEIWSKFTDALCLRFNWRIYGDNDCVHPDERGVLDRFTVPAPVNAVYNDCLPKGITENWHTKYSVKKKGPAQLFIHNAVVQGNTVNMQNKLIAPMMPWIEPCYDVAYVKHFITKSTEEFCRRRFNGTDACRPAA